MPRRQYEATALHPYHLGARCLNREWFRLPLPVVWEIFSEQLYFAHHAFNLCIHNFVLMSNHFHLVASTPDKNLSQTMNYFMRETSRLISRYSGRINQVYGAPYHRSLIRSEHYFMHAYKYVYRNPVEAGICSKVEDYQFSTLFGLLGRGHLLIPLAEDSLITGDANIYLDWLNKNYAADHKLQIKRALARSSFKFSLDRSNKRPSILEDELS
jgi:putative transposase